MDRKIGASFKNSGLYFLDEHALAADLMQRRTDRLGSIAERVDEHRIGLQIGRCMQEQVTDMLGLPSRERARPSRRPESGVSHDSSRSNNERSASAIRPPRTVPACSLSRTVGS